MTPDPGLAPEPFRPRRRARIIRPVLEAPSHGRFVGRAAELGRLDAALERAAAGRPNVAIIAGEAGVGKSWLAETFAERARAAGALALVGRCLDEGSGGYP